MTPIARERHVLRGRYPDGLICGVCALLLATRPESYAKSNLTEAERLSYVCAECRLTRAATGRAAGIRRDTLARNRKATGTPGPVLLYGGSPEGHDPDEEIQGDADIVFRYSPGNTSRFRPRRGGRPALAQPERHRRARETNRARQRTYRLRHRRP